MKQCEEQWEQQDPEKIGVFMLRSQSFHWEGLQATLEKQAGIRLVGSVEGVEEALLVIKEQKPDVIFLAGDLKGMPAVEVAARIRTLRTEHKLIVLADFLDQETLIVLGRVPIDAFLTWDSVTKTSLHCALRAVLEGLRVSTPRAVEELVAPVERRHHRRSEELHLTMCEREVLRGLAKGRMEKEIAEQGHVSIRTIEDTVARLKSKLGVGTLATLTAYAMELGFGDTWN